MNSLVARTGKLLRTGGPRLARHLLLAGLLLIPLSAPHAGSATATREIEHLLGYLAGSECEFYRNGRWYGAARAARHLRRKYDYYLDRTSAPTADEFIAGFASASSMSGKPYRVRCAGQPEQTSGPWFSRELERHRSAAQDRAAAPHR